MWIFSTGSDSNVMVWLRSRDKGLVLYQLSCDCRVISFRQVYTLPDYFIRSWVCFFSGLSSAAWSQYQYVSIHYFNSTNSDLPSDVLLVCGGDDGKISCFAQENDKVSFPYFKKCSPLILFLSFIHSHSLLKFLHSQAILTG